MKSIKKSLSTSSLGIITAFASSLCCILPVIALIAGTSSIASNISWLESARPYLIILSLSLFAFAWYQTLKIQHQPACDCDSKKKFIQSKTFLAILTVSSFLLLTFPSYSHMFFSRSNKNVPTGTASETGSVEFLIKGMTCTGCEHHVKSEILKLQGIRDVVVSYEKGNAIVKFDSKVLTKANIEKVINATGYKVVKHKTIKD